MYSLPVYHYVKPRRFQDKRLLRVWRLGQAEPAGDGICPASKQPVGPQIRLRVIRSEEQAQRPSLDCYGDYPIPRLKRAISPGLAPYAPPISYERERKRRFGDVRTRNVQIIKDKMGRPIPLCRQFKMVRSFKDFFNLFSVH